MTRQLGRHADEPHRALTDEEYRDLLLGIIRKATARLRDFDGVAQQPRRGLAVARVPNESSTK
jgi:hypothetical protein